MKKLIAVLLAVCTVFALCACGAGKDIGGSVTSGEDDSSFQLGTINGGVYENSYLGVGISLDDSWSIYDEEQLAQLIGWTADQYDDEKYAEQIENADLFYDLFASANDGLVSVNVVIQNLGLLYGTVMDEDKIVDMTLEQMDEQLQSAGFSDISAGKITVDFAGAEHTGIKYSSLYQGADYFTQQVFIKHGKYMAIFTVSNFYEDITGDVLSQFYGIE